MNQTQRAPILVPGIMLAALTVALLALAIGTFSAVFSASAQTGSWTVQYYNGTTATGTPILTSTIAGSNLSLDYGAGSPAAGVPTDNWSAVYVSQQFFNQGTYEFVVGSDDGVRVFIDGALVLDRFTGRVYTEDRFTQSLTSGNHTIRIDYFEGIDLSRLTFQYFQTSGALTPGTGFATVTPFGTPAPTAGPTPTPLPPTRTPLPAIPAGALSGTVVRATVLLVRGAPFLGAPVVGRDCWRGRRGRVLRGQRQNGERNTDDEYERDSAHKPDSA